MKRAVIFLLLTVFAGSAGTQDLAVSFLEGEVQVREGSSWAALSIGDRLTPLASVQLSVGAYVELRREGSKIVFSQKGIYSLPDVLASARALGSAGAGEALSSRLSLLTAGGGRERSSVSGARAANEAEADESEWVTSSSQVFLDAGKEYLKAGRFEEAIDQFLQGLYESIAKDAPQIRYYLAYAHSLNGDTYAALKYAADLQPNGSEVWAADFTILKAKLFVDSNAFAQDVAWLTESRNDLSGDTQRAAIYHFLLGVGYRGIGDRARERDNFLKVVSISGDGDMGKAAESMLRTPE